MGRRTDPSRRRTAHQYKLDAATAIYDIAAEPNPQQAVLDTLVLVTLQWYAAEAHGETMFGPDAPLIRDATRVLKDGAWSLAARVMSEKQRADLLGVIDLWWQDHAGDAEIWYVRIGDFAGYGQGTDFEGALGAITGLPGTLLNAFVPVSDAAETLDDAQATAERVTWISPRLMILAQWRAEAIIFETLATTEIRRVLDTTDRAVTVADRATAAAETLPHEIAAQTNSVLSELAEQEESIRALLDETRETLDSVDQLASTSQNVAAEAQQALLAADRLTQSFDSMLQTMKEYGAQSARLKAEQWEADLANGAPPGKPFDVTEYTETLNAATRAIEETNRVLLNLQSVTEPNVLRERLDEASQAGTGFVDHISSRLERLALVSAAAAAVAGILVVLTFRLVPSRRGRSDP